MHLTLFKDGLNILFFPSLETSVYYIFTAGLKILARLRNFRSVSGFLKQNTNVFLEIVQAFVVLINMLALSSILENEE